MARGGEGQPRPQAPGERPRPGQGHLRGGCATSRSPTPTTSARWRTNKKKPEQQEWARAIRVQFLDQDGPGQHVNISGAAVIKGAKNREHAIRLIEFLAGDVAQGMYASSNFEYPVKAGVATDPLIESLGEFRADPLPLSEIARHRKAASRLVDRVGFEEGPGT